ncbi:ATP-binding protein [Novosphingobium sp.]|uniref:ATP-binding protein n=1 Tax=Novosphingobium sp. TaxID=1874826 RepID=UPI0025F84BF8|nr:ATP-binding protein [Novosphingobium sp.]
MIRVCFHGAESTGKSVLARKLAAEWECPLVPEYGRAYAENVSTDFTPDDLLAIGREQNRLMQVACADRPPLALLDTDPLMTAAWSDMLFGDVPSALLAYDKAELYLLFTPDVPWVADGTRLFGTHELRGQFAATARTMLERSGVPFETITGGWAAREAQVRAVIARAQTI